MSDFNVSHQFAVYIWVDGNGRKNSLFEQGHWMEMCRCITKKRADEIGTALSLMHPDGVQCAELVAEPNGGARFVGYKYIPQSSRYNK
jgi:hypothetical protein